MKIFITGSEGFIGKFLSRALADMGHQIIGYDHKESNNSNHYKLITGDILNYNHVVESIPTETDLIIHLAAEHKDEGPVYEDYFRVNVEGTSHITKAAVESGVNKILFFSTVGVYGNQSFPNENSELKPMNDYGESKTAAEIIIQKWAHESSDRSGIIVRPTAVYGPGNTANIFRLIKQASTGMFIMPGNGVHHKSVIFVENVIASCIYLLDHFSRGVQKFNLVDEPSLSLNELVNLIRKVSGKSGKIFHIPIILVKCLIPLYGFLQFMKNQSRSLSNARLEKFASASHFDGRKIRDLGFQQPITSEDGIRKTIDWNRKHGWD